MTDLSTHFSKKNFSCRCGKCHGVFRISLTLVGILEQIREHYNKHVKIIHGYYCPKSDLRREKTRKSYHEKGQASDIQVEGISSSELFLYLETLPQVRGLGLYPEEDFVHLDVRAEEKSDKWIYYNSMYQEMTTDRRLKYNLKENIDIL